ncbi:MAG TPA: hypothetical protein PLX89_26885 [Verrucomicrobiota bacterium]|nr:hypothetical protein [Verrucomicrobiales bacterium]HRI16634.1 hypothetical protein [Verrucomicrobiota bacterium]
MNIAVGCSHACRFCYVPSAATIKQGPRLARFGVSEPDLEWGEYLLLRRWDEMKFLASLRAAETTPAGKLKPDGNRAVFFCSTTDPYQVIHHPDSLRRRELEDHHRFVLRRSLELIRDRSTLNVRILTRSPLARRDFDLFRTFVNQRSGGSRLLFGMSLPTLRNDLARVYEPRAPAPSHRLAALRAARAAGIPVFVALAPTYPECDASDLRATLSAVAEVQPVTIFHEPINIRAENISRIRSQADNLGISLNIEVFATRESWQDYAVSALKTVESLATELGVASRLHLWPDKSLGTSGFLRRCRNAEEHRQWLSRWWSRISEWPANQATEPLNE